MIIAKSLMMTNLPYAVSPPQGPEQGRSTHNNTVVPYFNPTPHLSSFYNRPLTNMDKIRYSDWVECELAVCVLASSSCTLHLLQTYPLYIFPGGLMIDPSPMEQYLPIEMTTC
jgi:hypothetical protein